MDFMKEITVMVITLRYDGEPCVGKVQWFLWYSKPRAQRPTCCNPLEPNIAYCMSVRRNTLWVIIPDSCHTLAPPLRCEVSGQPSNATWLQPISRRSSPDGRTSCSQELVLKKSWCPSLWGLLLILLWQTENVELRMGRARCPFRVVNDFGATVEWYSGNATLPNKFMCLGNWTRPLPLKNGD